MTRDVRTTRTEHVRRNISSTMLPCPPREVAFCLISTSWQRYQLGGKFLEPLSFTMFSLTPTILLILSPAPWTRTKLGTIVSFEAWTEILVPGSCISFTFRMLRLTIKIKIVVTTRTPNTPFERTKSGVSEPQPGYNRGARCDLLHVLIIDGIGEWAGGK